MRKLGFAGFGRSTVVRILRKQGLALSPVRCREMGWLTFLKHYQEFIWASDFFTVTTATLRTYYILFALEIGSCRIRYWNVSTSPDGAWAAQQFRNLSIVNEDAPHFLIHDRDDKFTQAADAVLEVAGTRVVRVPARSPDLNGYAERAVRTLREECLDRIIILTEGHLRWVLKEFLRYYNSRRPHRSLKLLPPDAPLNYPREGQVAKRQILGGLVNDYYREAASEVF